MENLRFQMIIPWILVTFLAVQTRPSTALVSSSPELNPSYPKAISDLREALGKGLGLQAQGFKISEFDLRDALIGQSVAYEFDIEVNDRILPFKLLEDVKKWEYVDLPIFRFESKDENGLIEKEKADDVVEPVLAPFQLAGPMEIWIQDAEDMRLALPHDVDAGVLRKVVLADGAVVTVKGAKSVSLRQPLNLPLPLNQSGDGVASNLLSLAQHLYHISQFKEDSPILSLRIVGPTSLTTSPSSSSSSPTAPANRLKLKRLAPGLVELSSPSSTHHPITASGDATTLLSPTQFTTLWPITSINGTNTNLLGFEKLLTDVLGTQAQKKGSFKLLRADVSAKTYLKIGFGVEKKLGEEEGPGGKGIPYFQGLPEWRTKPESMRMQFEVLAKVEGDKVVPERVVQVNPVEIEDTVAPNLHNGNLTMSRMPIFNPPQNPLTL